MSSSKIQINNKVEKDDILTFTISNIDVCFVNALRRTIMTHIPTIILDTNNCIIFKNTIAGTTNEDIKHRLSGIPVHIKNTSNLPIQNYVMELFVENDKNEVQIITTKDFKIRNMNGGNYNRMSEVERTEDAKMKNEETNKYVYLSEQEVQEIFPSNIITNDYILFISLNPQFAPTIPGESLMLLCNFKHEYCGTNGMYSVACQNTFSNTVDIVTMKRELEKKKQQWKDEKMPPDLISLHELNWEKTDGLRICKANSFDFKLESNGVYTNNELIHLACDYLIEKIEDMTKNMEKYFKIGVSRITCDNSFDIILNNDNKEIDLYTFGYLLNYLMVETYYENGSKIIKLLGIKNPHPMDNFITLSISYNEATEINTIAMHINECLLKAKQIFITIKKLI